MREQSLLRFAAPFAFCFGLFAPRSIAQSAMQFQGMGFISSSFPDRYALAFGVSDDGQVAVGRCTTGPPSHEAACRWSAATGMQELPFTCALAVSADGSVVVGYRVLSSSASVAIRWTEAGGAVSLGYLPGGNSSEAQAVSNDGNVVTGTSTSSTSHTFPQPFRWTSQSGLVALGTINGSTNNESYCDGLSDDGTIAVGATPNGSGYQESFRWSASSGMEPLGWSGHGSNAAYATSWDGTVIVGRNIQDGSDSCAFRWTASTGMLTLGECSFANTVNAVSADGELLGGVYSIPGLSPACIWDAPHGWRNIQQVLSASIPEIDGWYLDGLTGVSADGQTWVGYCYDPDGYSQGWIAFIPRPAPCPPDVNGDRDVDLSDLALLLSIFGATPTTPGYSLACDIDRNGVIDLADLAVVLANFGADCP